MSTPPVFSFSDHFSFLKARFDAPGMVRGSKIKFSKALKIQPAFLSQVLKRKYPLSLEQADLANQFFDHSEDEGEYFLLLVGRDRSGTSSLKATYEKKLTKLADKRLRVVARLGKKSDISPQMKSTYYSSWIYGAVHIACTIPRMGSTTELTNYLGLPKSTVQKAIQFLFKENLIDKKDGFFVANQNWVRLGRDSAEIVSHHTNWRTKAVDHIHLNLNDGLHFSGVYSLNKKAAKAFQDKALDFLKEEIKKFESEKEEDLFSFGMDFFCLNRSDRT